MCQELLPERLREEVCRAVRHRLPLAVVMFHLNECREVEPTLDALTRAAARLTRAVVRGSDIVGLLGRGEFAVVANTTPEGAGTLAEHVVRHLQAFEFTCADGPAPVRLRYALSQLSDCKTADDLLAEARAALGPAPPSAPSPSVP